MTEDTFASIGLKNWIVQQCQGLGMKQPTPVQVNCIPSILKGNRGKTTYFSAAFPEAPRF